MIYRLVNKGAATAKAPGKTITNGVSLATPASGPTVRSTIPPVESLEPLWVAAGDEVGMAVETAGQTGGRTTDSDSKATKVHRATTVQPQTPKRARDSEVPRAAMG